MTTHRGPFNIPGDFLFEVAQEHVDGFSSFIIRGHIPTFDAADGFVDVSEFGDLTYLTSPETMNISSTDANDDEGDTGLRTLSIQGVDGEHNEISETVIMNGTATVATALAYLRVNTMIGLTAGSSGWNEGVITAVASAAATTQDEMDATESLSQSSHYTVPANHDFYPFQLELNASQGAAGQAPEIEFKVYARLGGEGFAWLQLFDKKLDTSSQNELQIPLPLFAKIPEKSDIRIRADTDQNTSEVRTRVYGIVVHNQ